MAYYSAARAMLRNFASVVSPRDGRTTGASVPCSTLAVRAWAKNVSVLWNTLPTSMFGNISASACPSSGEESPFTWRASGERDVVMSSGPSMMHGPKTSSLAAFIIFF